MTSCGIAATVTTAVFVMMLVAGINKAFVSSGDPLNVLVLRRGTSSELNGFAKEKVPLLRELPGIAKDSHGEPLVSPEWIVLVGVIRKDGGGENSLVLRGMGLDGVEIRPHAKLIAGRWFGPGQREVAVSRSVASRYRDSNLGDWLDFGNGAWKVTGIFEAGGTAADSEIWGDLSQVAQQFNRQKSIGSMYLRAMDATSAAALKQRVSDDQRLGLQGMFETEYYAEQTKSGDSIRVVGYIVAFTMAIGSIFAAVNTMYAAVAYRSREIAILRVLGFPRSSIVTSFLFESLLLALLGACIGIGLMLPFNGVPIGIEDQVSFSEFIFQLRITPQVVAIAMSFAISMGLIGGVAPASAAARREILATLNE